MAEGMRDLRVSLSSDSAGADYSWDTYNEPYFYGYETINYLNKSANVAVTQYSYGGKENGDRLYQCSGVDYVANLFNRRISYKLYWDYFMGTWYPPKLDEHFEEIAKDLDLDLGWHVVRNYYVACDSYQVEPQAGSTIGRRYEVHEGTISEIIDSLIGWSRDVPSMQYSVRVTNTSIDVYQRGAETKTVNLDTTGKLRRDPTYTVRKIYTAWSGSGSYIYSSDKSLTKAPFTGELRWGDRTLTYQDGYLMSDAGDEETTTFTYTTVGNESDGKYLSSKVVEKDDDDERTVTNYVYYQTRNEVYLGKETELHYDGADLERVIVTTHTPLGNGWYGTTTVDETPGNDDEDEEDKILSTSMGQGAPGGKVSQYLVETQQEGLTNDAYINDRRAAISGVARLRSTYPIHDIATLRRVAAAIDSRNGCTEYTVTVDVYGINNVIDVDTLVTLDSVTWYVQSNNIEITPLHKLQRLTLIRWE